MRADQIESLARATHLIDADARGRRADPWETLDEAKREANLASARFAPVLIAALGLEIVDGLHPGRRSALTDEELEAGSRLEHLRWCRFTRQVGRRTHPDLVPWRDLDEPTRELDRIRVRALPELLAQLGCSVIDRGDCP